MSIAENSGVINEKVSTVKCFNYTISESVCLSHLINIPLSAYISVRELAFRIITENKVPFTHEESLITSLKNFIEQETELFENEKVSLLSNKTDTIDRLKCHQKFNSLINASQIVCETPTSVNGDVKFSEMYHDLIHSGFVTQSLVSLEQCYSMAVSELISARNAAVENLTNYQSKEMENLIKQIGVTTTDVEVNLMSVKHFREVEDLQTKWDEDIASLKESQKSRFRDLIKKAYICYCNNERESIANLFQTETELALNECGKGMEFLQEWETLEMRNTSNMEESFTINLGSQLKTTHNLRLICKNVLDLCCEQNRLQINPSPQRIQTSMSLYSNSLSALILLVDNRVNSYSGIKKEFARICSQSTDFHFPTFDEQQQVIREINSKMKSDRMNSNLNHFLKPGDFYITKHSNLSQVHIVFHLVVDDTVSSSDLTSRHPVILGLRNILKLTHIYDITVLSLPLLLIHEMTEDITLQWCLKRAELVLKCVKGFMIEMASLSPTTEDNKTLQFIVPKDISEELFTNLASMLSGIFRLSNPLVLKTNDTVFNN